VRLPPGCVDVSIAHLADGRVRVRWTDIVGPEVAEVEADLDALAEWSRTGAMPERLVEHRQLLDTAIAVAAARCEGNRAELRALLD
jgi:hypothetical protein